MPTQWLLANMTVQSVAISPCGTFALVGSAGGSIDMFNLQSGMHRQSFPARITSSRKLQLERGIASYEEFRSRRRKAYKGSNRNHGGLS
jgi:hypothetical protein